MFDSKDPNDFARSREPSGRDDTSGMEMALGCTVASSIWAGRVVAAEFGVILNVTQPVGAPLDVLIANSFSTEHHSTKKIVATARQRTDWFNCVYSYPPERFLTVSTMMNELDYQQLSIGNDTNG